MTDVSHCRKLSCANLGTLKYPQKLERYQDTKEELRRKLKNLSDKEQRARTKNAEAHGIRDMGDAFRDAGDGSDGDSSRSRSSFGDRSPEESVFQPSGSDV